MTFEYNNQKYKLILMSLAGSRFYGTHYDPKDPNRIHPLKPDFCSDHDWRGVFIANPDTKLGLTGKIEEIEIKKDKDGNLTDAMKALIDQLNEKLDMHMDYETDLTLYEIKKFVTLALENNPNIYDIIFADDDAIQYINKKGRKLLDNKDIFMSAKTKFTFSGYANSQLNRILGHHKWVTKYPKTGIVLNALNQAYIANDIDYNFITDHFGGDVSTFVTGISQQDANKLGKVESMSWSEFKDLYSDGSDETLDKDEWDYYRKPQLIDYITAKSLKAHKFDLDSDVGSITTFEGHSNWHMVSLRAFLMTKASFRTISKTQYNIFTPDSDTFKGGIFGRNGDLKSSDTAEVGEFVCQISIDELNYKKDLDNIGKLWDWRCHRNEKRSVLEEHFGYDTKHASHLFRLLIGARNILTTGEYHPRLTGDNLVLIKSILNGEKSYEWIIAESAKIDKSLEEMYKTTSLPRTPNHKKTNELLLKLSRKF